MKDEKIIIPAKKLEYMKPGKIGMVKMSPKAYNMLVDIANESGMSICKTTSAIIEQAVEKDLIIFERDLTVKEGKD